jgi:hypothetical protein
MYHGMEEIREYVVGKEITIYYNGTVIYGRNLRTSLPIKITLVDLPLSSLTSGSSKTMNYSVIVCMI